jgi:gamma-glutamyltranspeptidase
VSADRIYIPTDGAHILVEKGTPKAHIADLERRGEIVKTMSFSGTAIQMLRLDRSRPQAAADPRKHGLAIY